MRSGGPSGSARPRMARRGDAMRLWRGLLLAGLVAAGAAHADSEAAIYCGSVKCVTLRAAAHGQSAEQRADWAMGLLSKYLGGKTAKFGTSTRGTDIQILLNGEVLLA